MSIGYSITIGYNSGYSGEHSDEEAWAALKAYAELPRTPVGINALAAEVTAYFPYHTLEGENVLAYCEIYSAEQYCPLVIRLSTAEHDINYIHIMASGGGASRTLKEIVARAFCRLVIKEMHRQGIEVNLNVN